MSVEHIAVATADRAAIQLNRFVRLAQVGLVSSVFLFVFSALLGPSAAEPTLPGSGPFRALALAPAPWVVTVSLWLAIASGAVGLGCTWAAMVNGWRPAINRVWAWGATSATILAVVPPLGSSDITTYSVYGRLAALGMNPYVGSADQLARVGDPVGLAYAGSWHDSPSVYGPVATAWQYTESMLAGSSMRMFTIVSQLASLAVFLGCAWLLDRMVRDQPTERLRVAVLWTANPLLIYLLVNSAHIDGLAVFLGVAAIAVLRRSPAAGGVLAALATCTKVSFILYVVGLGWALRQRSRVWKNFIVAVVVTGAIVVLPFMPEIVRPLSGAAKYVSGQSPWHFTLKPLTAVLPSDLVHQLLTVGVWVLVALVVWRVSAVLPKPASAATDPRRAGAWMVTLLSLGWLLSSTYFFAWYDAMAWAPLVLIPASRLDLVLLVRTAVVAIASVPGSAVHPSGALGAVTTLVSSSVSPILGLVLILLVVCGGKKLRLPDTTVGQNSPQLT